MALSSAAIAKQKYYNRQAKKGKITQAQARSMGAPLSSKISTSAKRTTSSSGNNIATDNKSYTVGGVTYQTKPTGVQQPDYFAQQPLPDWVVPQTGGAVYSGSKQNSSKAPSKSSNKSTPKPTVNTSNRTSAANIFNSVLGIPTANASSGQPAPKRGTPTAIGRGFQMLSDPFGLAKGQNRLGQLADMVPGISNYLFNQPGMELPIGENLTPAQRDAANTVVGGYTGDPNKDYSAPGAVLGAETNQPYNDPSVPSGGNDFANAYTKATGNNQPNRNPQPVTNPYTAPPTSDISSIVKALIEYQAQPDNTPVQNNESTQRQFLGNGYLSNGVASNGKGDYGIQGTLGSNNGLTDNTNPLQDMLNNILGIQPAQAQEMPQTAGFSMPQGYNLNQNNWMGVPNQTSWQPMQDYNTPKIQGNQGNVNQSVNQNTNPQTMQGGGVAQQYAQGTTGGSQGVAGFDNSGYKSAQKAQKKALDELIKSIKSQYATSTTQGTTALDQSKQQDLLKLSGLFNFANQDPNSEQRLQYEQRTNNDYAGQLKDLLSKLATGQSQDISGAKQGYQSSLAQIMQQQQQAKQAYQNQVMQQMSKAKSGGGGKQNIYTLATQMKNAGKSWGEIANTLGMKYGIDLTPGNANSVALDAIMTGQVPQGKQKQGASYSPDGSYTFNEVDKATGKKIFYDPQTNEPFIND